MTFKLGDNVSVQAHWRKTGAYVDKDNIEYEKIYEIEDEEGFVKVIDKDIPQIKMHRLYREEKMEKGVVCGVRYRTINVTLEYGSYNQWTDDYDEALHIEEREQKKLYMVATRMNTIRLVGEEDIELNL